ncbi:MAG: ABC transporter, permease protein 1 (cluster 1, maltose/g3p/polyamine/iron), partial [uncultured Acetobacteraceae bacterium]
VGRRCGPPGSGDGSSRAPPPQLRAPLRPVHRARRRRGGGGHPVPLGLHPLRLRLRLAPRRRAALGRSGQLRRAVQRCALRLGDAADAALHRAGRGVPAPVRLGRGARLPPPLPAAGPRARRVHPAHDGDAGGGGPGLDHDVPPPARRVELAAHHGGPAALHVGLQRFHGHPDPGAGGGVALDAAGDAAAARRPRGLARRSLRSREDRRRHPLAGLPPRHPAAADALHRGGAHHPHDRRAESLRHDLRHHPGRAGLGERDHQHLPLPPGFRFLQHGLRQRGRGGVLRHHHGPGGVAALDAAAGAADV